MINNTEALAVRESLLRQAASLLANPNASMTARQQLAGIIEGELENNLLHLLQHASITTPSNGDAEQAKIAMSGLARMLAAKETAA